MNDRIPSTREILAWRVLNRPIDQSWIDWAVSMLQAGHDTTHLAILAGMTPPFNQFEMVALVDKVLRELGRDWADRESVVKDYAVELLEKMLRHEVNSADAMCTLSDLCIELQYPPFLMDFYRLHFAQEDLRTSEVQWYWPDATRANIENIIHEYTSRWIQKNAP